MVKATMALRAMSMGLSGFWIEGDAKPSCQKELSEELFPGQAPGRYGA
jgi:hypothetical protein